MKNVRVDTHTQVTAVVTVMLTADLVPDLDNVDLVRIDLMLPGRRRPRSITVSSYDLQDLDGIGVPVREVRR